MCRRAFLAHENAGYIRATKSDATQEKHSRALSRIHLRHTCVRNGTTFSNSPKRSFDERGRDTKERKRGSPVDGKEEREKPAKRKRRGVEMRQKSSSGEAMSTKQKTRARRARAYAYADIDADDVEGCFATSRGWHAEKLFRGKGRGIHCATPPVPRSLSRKSVSGRCTRAARVHPPESARKRSFRRLVKTIEKPEGDK